MKTLLVLLAAQACLAQNGNFNPRSGRGMMDDLERMWDGVHDGIDQLQANSRVQFRQQFRPMAQRVEAQMRTVEDRLSEAFDHMMGPGGPMTGFGASTGSAPGPSASGSGSGPDRVDEEEPSGPGMFHPFHPSGGAASSGSFNPFNLFGLMGGRANWWEGPNVCVDRKVIDDDQPEANNNNNNNNRRQGGGQGGAFMRAMMMDMTMTSCRDGDSFHECTTHVNTNGRKKTVVVKHACCFGFVRDVDEEGCVKADLKPVPETLNELKADEFVKMLKEGGFMDKMEKANVTVFAPTNEAIEDFKHDLQQLDELDGVERPKKTPASDSVAYSVVKDTRRRKRSPVEVSITNDGDDQATKEQIKNILSGHLMDGFVDTSSMDDDSMLAVQNGGKVRISMYNTVPRTVMANCAKIVSRDHMATNGVVHMVDKVVMPATKSLAELLEDDVQFRTLVTSLKASGLMKDLAANSNNSHVTVFAPTDAAFDKLDAKMKQRISSGSACSRDILSHHVVPNVICSSVVETVARTVNVNGKHLVLERSEVSGDLTVDGRRIVVRDVVATNGVIQVIEDVLLPESSRSMEEALRTEGFSSFHSLFKESGLDADGALTNATIFAPSEKAMSALPEDFKADLVKDKSKLREFLLYHVVTPKTCQCEFANNKMLPTGVKDKQLRMNSYGNPMSPFGLLGMLSPEQPVATVQCALVTRRDTEACGGMIHTVDKVLLPPAGNVIEIAKNNGKFGSFLKLVAFSELENELSTEGPFTLLAPTDAAFDHFKEDVKKKAFEDKDYAVKLVRHHVMSDSVCCSGIPRQLVPMLADVSGRRMMSGDVVALRRSRGSHIYADRAEVTECDMVASNGVVHALDRVLLLPERNNATGANNAPQRRNGLNVLNNIFKIFE